MNFAETMETNPPRVVVLFQRASDGGEHFQWGVVGAIPILSLVGYIHKVQNEIVGGGWIPECDQLALVITWDERNRELSHFAHPELPTDSTVGMLETIKAVLVASRMGQHAAAQQVQILGPDGRPMRVG